jgi:hypothetical protein
MMKRLLWASSFVALALLISACSGSKPTSNTSSKPTNSNTSASATKKEAPKPQTPIANKPKPADAKTKDVPNKVPTPKDWIYMYDDVKGYGFYVPEGSKGDSGVVDNVSTFYCDTPSGIGVVVYAWKDANHTKESLMESAIKVLGDAWGATVTAGKLEAESEDYAIAEASATGADGKKSKMKILVGTDVTDNYVMFVFTDADKFEANKQIIEEIWGSFEMYSGGASGNS